MANATKQHVRYADEVLAMIEPTLDEVGHAVRILRHPQLKDGFELQTRRAGAPSVGEIVVTARRPHSQRPSRGPRFEVALSDWWGDTKQARWYGLTASEAASLVLSVAQHWPQRSYKVNGYATAATPASKTYRRFHTLEDFMEAHPRRKYVWEVRVEISGKHRVYSERRLVGDVREQQMVGPGYVFL